MVCEFLETGVIRRVRSLVAELRESATAALSLPPKTIHSLSAAAFCDKGYFQSGQRGQAIRG